MPTPSAIDAGNLDRQAGLEQALARAYAVAVERLQADLTAVQAHIAAARAAGQQITPTWLLQEQRLQALVAQAETQMRAFARTTEQAITEAQRDAVLAGTADSVALIASGFGAPAGTQRSFDRLSQEAIAQLVGRAYDGSPLTTLLDQLGPHAAQQVQDALIAGLAAGDNPRLIAQALRSALDDEYSRALTIARTETLNAYRGAALANYRANSDVVTGWEWHTARGCCDACQAKSGKLFPLDAPFDEHPNGRCVPLPKTKTWAELGIPMSHSGAVIGGTFTVTSGGSTSAPIPYHAPSAAVQAALQELRPMQQSTFALDAPPVTDGDVVVRRGLIFRAGDYPDKQFVMTPDELKAAAAAFEQPVPVGLEHVPTLLDGQLGELRAVEASADGMALYGDVALPAWLDRLLPERKVSATWDRATKTLRGLALVRHPRVSDAALMAAFADHRTWEGQDVLQALHDLAARHGAMCAAPERAEMHSVSEVAGLQAIHDAACAAGASCHAIPMDLMTAFALFAGKRNSSADQRALQQAHDAIVHAGAECAPAQMSKEKRPMWKEFWAGLFGAAKDAGADSAVFASQAAVVLPAAAQQQADSEVAALRVQLAQERAERIASEAAAFADGEIAAHRAYPAEREAIIAAFTQAAVDDQAHGAVTFGEGQTTSRVAQIKALAAVRPAHTLTQEQVPGNAAFAVTNPQQTPAAGAEQPMSAERRAELLKASTLGRAVVEQ